MSRLFQIAVVSLLLVGGGFVAGGLWIPAKAVLAQQLLLRAWEESLATGEPVKAWRWADTWPVGRLKNQRLGVDLIVLEGVSGEVLAFGPGHLSRSSSPGEVGHCILAGHRDTSFAFLRNLIIGDRLILQGNSGSTVYLVQATAVTPSAELYLDADRQGLLTLITCYPFGDLSSRTALRFVVSAEEMSA